MQETLETFQKQKNTTSQKCVAKLELCILSIHDKMKSCSPDSELFYGEENGGGRFLKFSKVWVRQAKLKK